MNYEEFLQLKIEEQNKKNIEDFIMYLNSSAGKTKVKNFLQRNSDLPVQNIVQDATNGNPYAIALLRKDPTKQNISEKSFFEFTGLKNYRKQVLILLDLVILKQQILKSENGMALKNI